MSRQVSDTSYGVALDLDIGTKHLADKGLEAAERDDEQFVLRCLSAKRPQGRRIATHG
jgi:hypothetical protein